MPNNEELVAAFMDSIPEEKLSGFLGPGIVFSDGNFRLDMQGLTTGAGEYNLQVQVNKNPVIPSLARLAPKTIAGPVFVSEETTKTPAEIRAEMKDNIKIFEHSCPDQPDRYSEKKDKKKKKKKGKD